jgi:hypothetical protein
MSVANVVQAVDKANGYVFGGLELANESIFEVAARADHGQDEVGRIQEQYIDHKEWSRTAEIRENMPTDAGKLASTTEIAQETRNTLDC